MTTKKQLAPKQEFATRPVEGVARELLRISQRMNIVDDALMRLGIDVNGMPDPLGLALDLLGVPVDNTIETDACERANRDGVWPEDAYCRDWAYDEWDSGHGWLIPDFVATVRRTLAEVPAREGTDE